MKYSPTCSPFWPRTVRCAVKLPCRSAAERLAWESVAPCVSTRVACVAQRDYDRQVE